MVWRTQICPKLRVYRIEQIAVSSIKRERSERKRPLRAIRARLVLHGLEHRTAHTLRHDAISQGCARIRVDLPRANGSNSIGLMLEDDYLIFAYTRRSRRVMLHLPAMMPRRASSRWASDA